MEFKELLCGSIGDGLSALIISRVHDYLGLSWVGAHKKKKRVGATIKVFGVMLAQVWPDSTWPKSKGLGLTFFLDR